MERDTRDSKRLSEGLSRDGGTRPLTRELVGHVKADEKVVLRDAEMG